MEKISENIRLSNDVYGYNHRFIADNLNVDQSLISKIVRSNALTLQELRAISDISRIVSNLDFMSDMLEANK